MAGKLQAGREGELSALGVAVRRRREAMGYSVSELARRSGVSRRMLQGVEVGARNPSVRTLMDLAAALGTRASEMLAEAELDPDL